MTDFDRNRVLHSAGTKATFAFVGFVMGVAAFLPLNEIVENAGDNIYLVLAFLLVALTGIRSQWHAIRMWYGWPTFVHEAGEIRGWLDEMGYDVEDREPQENPPRHYQIIARHRINGLPFNVSHLVDGDRVLIGINLPLEPESQAAFDRLTVEEQREIVRGWRRDFAQMGIATGALQVPDTGEPMRVLLRRYIYSDKQLNEHTLREGVDAVRRAVLVFQNSVPGPRLNQFTDTEAAILNEAEAEDCDF
jgi:hypothetical protein